MATLNPGSTAVRVFPRLEPIDVRPFALDVPGIMRTYEQAATMGSRLAQSRLAKRQAEEEGRMLPKRTRLQEAQIDADIGEANIRMAGQPGRLAQLPAEEEARRASLAATTAASNLAVDEAAAKRAAMPREQQLQEKRRQLAIEELDFALDNLKASQGATLAEQNAALEKIAAAGVTAVPGEQLNQDGVWYKTVSFIHPVTNQRVTIWQDRIESDAERQAKKAQAETQREYVEAGAAQRRASAARSLRPDIEVEKDRRGAVVAIYYPEFDEATGQWTTKRVPMDQIKQRAVDSAGARGLGTGL